MESNNSSIQKIQVLVNGCLHIGQRHNSKYNPENLISNK